VIQNTRCKGKRDASMDPVIWGFVISDLAMAMAMGDTGMWADHNVVESLACG